MSKDKAYVFKIVKIARETRDVKTFTLKITKDTNFEFLPRQYVEISFHDTSKNEWKGHSISSSPIKKEHIDITVLNRGRIGREKPTGLTKK